MRRGSYEKLLAFLMAIMVFATMAAGCGGSSDKKDEKKPAAQKFINIATGGTAGTYFPLGGAIADILNKNVPGANASAQSTGASVANINLLQQDKVDIALYKMISLIMLLTVQKCSKIKKSPVSRAWQLCIPKRYKS